MQRYLVIGGAGFIGSNLVKKLVSDGGRVDVIDNMHTGKPDNLSGVDNVKIVSENVYAVKNLKLDDYTSIFYLGMPSSSPMYKENPCILGETVKEALCLLEEARKSAFQGKMVLASTSSLYNGNTPPFKEDDCTVYVKDYYTECRFYIERLFELYHNLYGLKAVALRLFSVYGPGEEYKDGYANMLTQFLWNMMKGKTIVVYGDGSQTRDFTYVSDVVRAFQLAAESNIGWDVFNVGTGVETSFNQLIDLIRDTFNVNLNVEYVENPIKNYVQRTLADTGKAERKLKFKAKVPLKEGLIKTYEYYKSKNVV